LWSSKTQASKKVVGCSISVTEWSEARRARKDISVLPGYDVTTWYGVFAPRDTPGAIIAKLNTSINESLKEEAVQKRLTTAGVVVRGSTAEAFGQHMAREFGRWNAVCEAAGIPQQ
jgi:Tripartite tricarboxylate transporter family receptor